MRHILYLLFCLALIGCGTTASIKYASKETKDEATFLLLDERHSQEKNSREETNVDGKNYYFGDDNISPVPSELLKNTLKNELNNKLSGKKITLTDFTIHVYEPAVSIDRETMDISSATVPGGAAVAPLAEIFISVIEGMKSEKNLMVKISGDVDGSPFSGSQYENFKGRVTESNIKEIINIVLQDVVSQVRVIITDKNTLTSHSSGTPNGAP